MHRAFARVVAAATPSLLELAGATAVVGGIAMWSVPLALVAGGLLLVAAGLALTPPRPRGRG